MNTAGVELHGYALVASNVPLNVVGLVGNWARVPVNGTAQKKPTPIGQRSTAKAERADREAEELVFINRCAVLLARGFTLLPH